MSRLIASFHEDFRCLLPRLQQACVDRDDKAAIQIVHGLKGGGLTLGWSRFVAACSHSLDSLRAGVFSEWSRLPVDLENLFEHSLGAIEATMEAWPAQAGQAIDALHEPAHHG